MVGWIDGSSGDGDIYVQHLQASGALAEGWPSGGLAVCTARSSQYQLSMVGDGAGGAFLAWCDYRAGGSGDIYSQHVLASGSTAAGWSAGGVAVCTLQSDQVEPSITPDGNGGAIVVWQDSRSGARDVFAHHIQSSGTLDSGWPTTGVRLCDDVGSRSHPLAVSDGAGGALVGWEDGRDSLSAHLCFQRVSGSGALAAGWSECGLIAGGSAGYQQSRADRR